MCAHKNSSRQGTLQYCTRFCSAFTRRWRGNILALGGLVLMKFTWKQCGILIPSTRQLKFMLWIGAIGHMNG